MTCEERVHSLVLNAIVFKGPLRVGYSHEEFETARAQLPLEHRRQQREGWACPMVEAVAWLDRFDPGSDD